MPNGKTVVKGPRQLGLSKAMYATLLDFQFTSIDGLRNSRQICKNLKTAKALVARGLIEDKKFYKRRKGPYAGMYCITLTEKGLRTVKGLYVINTNRYASSVLLETLLTS